MAQTFQNNCGKIARVACVPLIFEHNIITIYSIVIVTEQRIEYDEFASFKKYHHKIRFPSMEGDHFTLVFGFPSRYGDMSLLRRVVIPKGHCSEGSLFRIEHKAHYSEESLLRYSIMP